jgi:hypothetical protein
VKVVRLNSPPPSLTWTCPKKKKKKKKNENSIMYQLCPFGFDQQFAESSLQKAQMRLAQADVTVQNLAPTTTPSCKQDKTTINSSLSLSLLTSSPPLLRCQHAEVNSNACSTTLSLRSRLASNRTTRKELPTPVLLSLSLLYI